MEDLNKITEIQNKFLALIKERQTQLIDLKNYFDKKNKKLYKDIIHISDNLNLFEDLFLNKIEFKSRIENILSLGLSFGKIIDFF